MKQSAVQAISAVGNQNLASAVIDARQLYRIAGQVIVGNCVSSRSCCVHEEVF